MKGRLPPKPNVPFLKCELEDFWIDELQSIYVGILVLLIVEDACKGMRYATEIRDSLSWLIIEICNCEDALELIQHDNVAVA